MYGSMVICDRLWRIVGVMLICSAYGVLCGGEVSAFSLPLDAKKTRMLQIDIALSSVFEYHTRNLQFQRPAHAYQYMDLRNKLDLNVQMDQYRLGGRLDTYNFFADSVPCPESFPDCKSRYLPEKIYLSVRKANFDFTAGDFYLTLGRGIALSIRKVDEFGIDNTLRGARLSFDDGAFRATVAGGFVNPTNFDPIQETLLPDTNDFIFASHASQRFGDLLTLGAQYVWFNFAPQADESGASRQGDVRIFYTHIAGGSVQFDRLWQRLDVYFEGNGLLQRYGLQDTTGYALYSSINAYLFPVTLRFEAQWNRHFAVQPDWRTKYRSSTRLDLPTIETPPLSYINPPSMDREDLDHLGDTSNVRGLRLRLDYTLPSREMVLYLNYMLRVGFAETIGIEPLYIHHIYAGMEYRSAAISLNTSLGWRETIHHPNWRVFHIDGDLSYQFLPRHSANLKAKYSWNGKEEHQYHLFDAQIGYAFSKIASLAVLLSYSDEDMREGINKFYVAAELQVFLFGYGSVKLLYGAMRGGLQCISGMCRVLPPFEGFRTELSLRF